MLGEDFFVTLSTCVVILFRFGSTFVLPLKRKNHRVHTVRLASGLLYNTELTLEEEGEVACCGTWARPVVLHGQGPKITTVTNSGTSANEASYKELNDWLRTATVKYTGSEWSDETGVNTKEMCKCWMCL